MAIGGETKAMRRAGKSAARARLSLRGWRSPWTKAWPVTTSWLVPLSGGRRRRAGERVPVHHAAAKRAAAHVAARESQQSLLPGEAGIVGERRITARPMVSSR